MNLWLSGWAALVFGLTLLVQAPAAFYLQRIAWLGAAQPQGISGTLWHGQMASLGELDQLAWSLRPWAGEARLRAGLQQQDWQLTLRGLPWNWRAELQPTIHGRAVQADWQMDGEWQGRVQLQGSGLQCRAAQGQLVGRNLGLLAPWTIPLGAGRLSLTCENGQVQLAGQLERAQQHSITFKADLASRSVQLSGTLESNATLQAPLLQAHWLKAGESGFSRRIQW